MGDMPWHRAASIGGAPTPPRSRSLQHRKQRSDCPPMRTLHGPPRGSPDATSRAPNRRDTLRFNRAGVEVAEPRQVSFRRRLACDAAMRIGLVLPGQGPAPVHVSRLNRRAAACLPPAIDPTRAPTPVLTPPPAPPPGLPRAQTVSSSPQPTGLNQRRPRWRAASEPPTQASETKQELRSPRVAAVPNPDVPRALSPRATPTPAGFGARLGERRGHLQNRARGTPRETGRPSDSRVTPRRRAPHEHHGQRTTGTPAPTTVARRSRRDPSRNCVPRRTAFHASKTSTPRASPVKDNGTSSPTTTEGPSTREPSRNRVPERIA